MTTPAILQAQGKGITRSVLISDQLPLGMHGKQIASGWLCPFDARNAATLRAVYTWLRPSPVGLRKSIGCGDRLGVATAGHIEAVREGDLFPVFAQQSIREMSRAGRTPQQVMDDAMWGVLAADYQNGWGGDADHLKTTQAIDDCIAVGFIGFTLDPGDYVDNDAHTDDEATLRAKYAALPWDSLETTATDFERRYKGVSLVEGMGEITTESIMRAACKYGRALTHVLTLARHIQVHVGARAYDLEISVDETETPTSPVEHYIIASELRRLSVPFTGLAPRFIGRFEKAVDYIGDLAAFEADFSTHVRVQREIGGYKLSIHSGSDKFSLYPIIAKHANPLVHLKTAGTSWLEALRVIARCEPTLMQSILAFALARYPQDKTSYHVSAELARIPVALADIDLPALLDHFDARQVLHVTFGSLLAAYRVDIYAALEQHAEDYRAALKAHFSQHIAPFTGV